jgi:hypothetical protein
MLVKLGLGNADGGIEVVVGKMGISAIRSAVW